MCSEKEAGRAGKDWGIEKPKGMFLGETGRPSAYENDCGLLFWRLKSL